MLILHEVVRTGDLVTLIFLHGGERFHLVVAAPQAQARVVAQTPYIFLDFRSDIGFEPISEPIIGAGEHHILPYDKAHLIAQIIEIIERVEPAAPDADRVEVGLPADFEQFACPFRAHAGKDVVLRDVIGTHGKERPAVDLRREALAPFVLPAADCTGTEANALRARLSACGVLQLDLQLIEGLIAEAVRPPQLRIRNAEWLSVRETVGISVR